MEVDPISNVQPTVGRSWTKMNCRLLLASHYCSRGVVYCSEAFDGTFAEQPDYLGCCCWIPSCYTPVDQTVHTPASFDDKPWSSREFLLIRSLKNNFNLFLLSLSRIYMCFLRLLKSVGYKQALDKWLERLLTRSCGLLP